MAFSGNWASPGRKNRLMAIVCISFSPSVFDLHCVMDNHTVAHQWRAKWLHYIQNTTTILWPFFPLPPGWAGARRELLDFMVQGKINRGRHADHPAGRHSIRTNQCPPPSYPIFLQAGSPSCHPTNSVKALKAISAFGLRRYPRVLFSSMVLPAPSPYLSSPYLTLHYITHRTTTTTTILRLFTHRSRTILDLINTKQ